MLSVSFANVQAPTTSSWLDGNQELSKWWSEVFFRSYNHLAPQTTSVSILVYLTTAQAKWSGNVTRVALATQFILGSFHVNSTRVLTTPSQIFMKCVLELVQLLLAYYRLSELFKVMWTDSLGSDTTEQSVVGFSIPQYWVLSFGENFSIYQKFCWFHVYRKLQFVCGFQVTQGADTIPCPVQMLEWRSAIAVVIHIQSRLALMMFIMLFRVCKCKFTEKRRTQPLKLMVIQHQIDWMLR